EDHTAHQVGNPKSAVVSNSPMPSAEAFAKLPAPSMIASGCRSTNLASSWVRRANSSSCGRMGSADVFGLFRGIVLDLQKRGGGSGELGARWGAGAGRSPPGTSHRRGAGEPEAGRRKWRRSQTLQEPRS